MISRFLRFPLAVAFVLLLLVKVSAEKPLPPPPPLDPLLSSSHELYGKDARELIKEGSIRAIKSAIGRIYFSEYMLRGRSLLDAYIDQNWPKFIARSKVKANEIRGGRRFVALDVVVDVPVLYKDLAEKRFFYRPGVRPVFYIFLKESYDGEPTPPVGRLRLLQLIDERQYRYLWDTGFDKPSIPVGERQEVVVSAPMPQEDASRSGEALQEAANQAQRNEVELFITGSIESRTTRKEKVYFEDYTFVETRASLKLVRSDTAEVIASAETVTSAGNPDPAGAVAAATKAAMDEIGAKLLDAYAAQWGKMILDKANVRIMITGVTPDTLPLFRQLLKQAAPDAEVYVRSLYADVAVVTVSWTDGSTAELIDLLRRSFFPAFRIKVVAEDRMILEVVPDKGTTSLKR